MVTSDYFEIFKEHFSKIVKKIDTSTALGATWFDISESITTPRHNQQDQMQVRNCFYLHKCHA